MVAQPLYMGNAAFANYVEPTSAPAGYMTSSEFRQRAIEKVKKFCDKNGIL
jgi:hypothetical protein